MPKIEEKKIEHLNVRLPLSEMATLRTYCEATQRTQSDVIREFIRSLDTSHRQSPCVPRVGC